jgi:hypothetical protein
MANRSERRSWDKYVAEARETKSEWDFGDEKVTIYIPSADAFTHFTVTSDLWESIGHLIGEENAEVVKRHSAGAPVTALNSFVEDVLKDLGLDNNDSGE